MKLTFAAIFLFLPFILPVILQFVFGSRSIKSKTNRKIWQIALINMTIMVFCVFLLDIFMMRPATARTHDGLAYLGLAALAVITLIIILSIAIIEYVIKHRKQKRMI